MREKGESFLASSAICSSTSCFIAILTRISGATVAYSSPTSISADLKGTRSFTTAFTFPGALCQASFCTEILLSLDKDYAADYANDNDNKDHYFLSCYELSFLFHIFPPPFESMIDIKNISCQIIVRDVAIVGLLV